MALQKLQYDEASMRIVVVGASGMLGHRLVHGLSSQFEVTGTVRGDADRYRQLPPFARGRLTGGVDAAAYETVERAVVEQRPDVVINAIGAIKQVSDGKSAVPAIRFNALFPHLLAQTAEKIGARFITFGTDCVFSGRQGPYSESDTPDATDVYGRSKLLGEVTGEGCLTLRTSIVGRELRGGHSLFEWFLSQNGKTVKGYRRALYTGMTTGAATDLVAAIIRHHPKLDGLWQVAGPEISKLDLLRLVASAMDLDVRIEPDDDFHCDRRLDGSRFNRATGLVVPAWREMIAAMVAEARLYGQNAGI